MLLLNAWQIRPGKRTSKGPLLARVSTATLTISRGIHGLRVFTGASGGPEEWPPNFVYKHNKYVILAFTSKIYGLKFKCRIKNIANDINIIVEITENETQQ